jgi:hypothetical protein
MNTRILLISFLAAAALAAAATPARAGSYVVVGCSDLGSHAVRPPSGWYLAAGGYPSRDDCGAGGQVRLAYGGARVTLRLTVRVYVLVHIRRRGPLTQVSGRVRGGRIPRAGLRLRLQSRGFGGWRTQPTLHADGLGRFSASGRAAAGARLRVVVPTQRGYPYARGVGRP